MISVFSRISCVDFLIEATVRVKI